MKISSFFASLVIVFFIGFSLTGAYNADIYYVQKKLKELGYNPGKVDGIWGKATRRALIQFQKDNDLPVTGQIDERTEEKLGKKNHSEEKVKTKQHSLAKTSPALPPPKNAKEHFERGNFWYNKGEYDKAIDNYTKAIDLNPNAISAYNNRGCAWGRKGEIDKAVEDFTYGIDKKFGFAFYYNRALSWFKKGQKNEAKRDLKEAIKLNSALLQKKSTEYLLQEWIVKPFAEIIGMKFVFIPPGTFMMGSPSGEFGRDNDEKQHRVTLSKGFYMQSTEVTQGQWQSIMGSNPSYFKNCGANCPVEQVSWNDAQAFIRRLNQKEGTDKYRLPTEAEWEYACRAGTKTPFYTGNRLLTDQANYNGNHPMPGCPKGEYRERTVRAGSFPPNPWGLYDMHGNVWEWCQDCKGDYPYGQVTDPKGPSSGKYRVFRGGSWFSDAGGCRSAYRSRRLPGVRSYRIGFRLARDF